MATQIRQLGQLANHFELLRSVADADAKNFIETEVSLLSV